MSEITTNLFYGQKVYLALAKCACSESVHDVSYTKLGAGYVRKYIEDNDSYMVEVTNNGSTTVNTYCCCNTLDVACDTDKKELKEIAHNHIFVLELNDRTAIVDEGLKISIGDIINIYPYSDKYKIIAFSSDMKLVLACNVNGIATNGMMSESQMVIVNLDDPSTFISIGDGTPVIPYVYEVPDDTTTTEEPQYDEDGNENL